MSENSYPDRHWRVVRETWRAVLKSLAVTGVIAALLTSAAILWDGWAFVAAVADAIFLLVCWGSICSVVDVTRYATIHPYFEKSVGEIDTFASGYEVARRCLQLDQIATEHAVIPLSRFGFNDDMCGEHVEWHDAAAGLATFRLLAEEIERHPDRFARHKKLAAELNAICHALQRASEQGIRFSLLLRHNSGTNAMEWEQRKGSAF